MLPKKVIIKSIEDLESLCEKLLSQLKYPCMLLLNGDLGTGKTTFIQQLCKAVGYSGQVNSPTFTKIHEYPTQKTVVYHLDIYRELPTYLELEEILMVDNAIVCIEWADKLKQSESLKEIYEINDREVVEINFSIVEENIRELDLSFFEYTNI